MSTRNNFSYNSGKQLDISYNALNLPRMVDNGANGKMQFVYNSAGQKLRTTLYDSPSNITDTSDYIGNFIYKNGKLSYILMPEGRILPNGSGFAYEYHLKDHLGNTRATYIAGANVNATLTQTTAYYPFGLPINALSSNLENNPYLYNGKELHSELNLDLFDYGARFYDAEVGRFLQVDPLAEKYNFQSPYAYAANNPIKFIDLNGMGPTSTHTDEDGNVIAVYDDGDLGVYKHSGKGTEALKNIEEHYSEDNTSASGLPLFGLGSCLSRFMNKGFALVYKKFIFEKNKRKMSTAYKIAKKEAVYYPGFQVVAWVDIFTCKIYRDNVIDSFENNLNDGKSHIGYK